MSCLLSRKLQMRARPAQARVVHAHVARPTRAPRVSTESPTSVDPVWLFSTMLAGPLIAAEPALAKEGAFGILEGRSFALIHPIGMGSLLALTMYAGWLGLQWRETRTIGDKIKNLKKELPPKDSEGNRPTSPIDDDIKAMEEMRKDLVKGNYLQRHHDLGSILLAFGVTIAVGGCFNTWFRTGKLFPGPHLFAGAGIVCLWAIAAALVPAMKQGKDWARIAHISANCLNVFLFLWQVPTGLEIVGKVFQFTTWP